MWAQGCVANMAVLMRLLLAEDDLGLRGVLQRGLSEEGYVVDAVPTGNEALEHLRTYEYAICVVDWRMQGASGLDIITCRDEKGHSCRVCSGLPALFGE